jgi:hypothetical protein
MCSVQSSNVVLAHGRMWCLTGIWPCVARGDGVVMLRLDQCLGHTLSLYTAYSVSDIALCGVLPDRPLLGSELANTLAVESDSSSYDGRCAAVSCCDT